MSALLLASVLVPIVLAPLTVIGCRLQTVAQMLAVWAPLPALALAVLTPSAPEIELPWLLLGTRLGMDLVGRVFLLFTASLWLASGVYARAYLAADGNRARFFGFYLLAASGNLGLIVAQDLATFYLFFALMTFSAYGLIVHRGDRNAFRAGRIYIVLALLGEALLLAGGLLAAVSAPSLALGDVAATLAASPRRDLAMALLFAGFGVKAGILPLHVWLPLAHPVAPTPASAVLSGSMIAAGLLGWIRFFPLGEAALPGWGAALILLGLTAAFFGVAVGLVQEDPKTILAYSSISQMGIMSATLGTGLLHPAIAPAAVGGVLLYAVHHGFVKGALFLGVGVAASRPPSGIGRTLVPSGLAFAALTMAGAPMTSGSVAKHAVKEVTHLGPEVWAQRLDMVLPLTAVGTAMLMARFLQRALAPPDTESQQRLVPGIWIPWLALLLASAGALWVLPRRLPMHVDAPGLPDLSAAWQSAWPAGLGGMLFWGAILFAGRIRPERQHLGIPAGDILVVLERAVRPLWQRVGRWEFRPLPDPIAWVAANWYGVYARRESWPALQRMELLLTHWATAGFLFLLLGLALLGLLFGGGG